MQILGAAAATSRISTSKTSSRGFFKDLKLLILEAAPSLGRWSVQGWEVSAVGGVGGGGCRRWGGGVGEVHVPEETIHPVNPQPGDSVILSVRFSKHKYRTSY